jgi:ERCC4-related helicase
LAALAWMVAHDVLDVKVAVPIGSGGKPVHAPGIYHEKVGVIADAQGDRISFSGSINETAGGWLNNRESFHVHCSWEGGREAQHVADEVAAFARLWEGRSTSTKVFDFPDAALHRLLEFLPHDDRFITPPQSTEHVPPVAAIADDNTQTETDSTETLPAAAGAYNLLPEEISRVVWTFIGLAAAMWNGTRVGEKTSAISPWRHQIRCYLRMLQSWPCRLLIADEVGLGKTVSAGLLIRQASLSGKAERILIMVPAGVLIQWQNELYEKFNLDVPIYDGQRLRWRQTHGRRAEEKKVGRDEWTQRPLVLCSSHLMRRRDRVGELLGAEPWDLVVLDEAHHARRRGAGTPQEHGPNALLRLMRELKSRCRALVLLTATPMQVHPVEMWDLLDLLGLPESCDSDAFIRYFELASGNPDQNGWEELAAMFRETETAFGSIDEEQALSVLPGVSPLARRKILKALRDPSGIPLKRLNTTSRKAALALLRGFSPVRCLMARHTRELLRLYHQQGNLDAPIAKRSVCDVPVELSQAERDLYDDVEDHISHTYNAASEAERTAVGFVMTIYRRRLASSFYALRCTLTNRLANLAARTRAAHSADEAELDGELSTVTGFIEDADVSQDELTGEVMAPDEADALVRQASSVNEEESIRNLLKDIAKLGTDSKARKLHDHLQAVFADGYDSAIVFTQYTDTLDYLKDYLADLFPDLPIGCYSGDGGAKRDRSGSWTRCTKEQIKLALKNKTIRLLICNDAAGEGLNLQYTGVLVNYDLPWNPMKVEQRIGRIDRIGQQHPIIRVINLAYKDTVEADVYFALGQRINLFQGIVGKLQPILSRLPKQFEQVALERPEHREAAKRRLLADVEQSVAVAEEASFDIDEVARESLQLPELPEPALTLDDLEAALNIAAVRPAGMEWQQLDPGSYATRLPGMFDKVRTTPQAEVFDDHCDSHLFLSPGGWFFKRLLRLVNTNVGEDISEQTAAHYWLVRSADGRVYEMIVFTNDGPQRISSLRELLDSFSKLGPPGQLDANQFPKSQLIPLA